MEDWDQTLEGCLVCTGEPWQVSEQERNMMFRIAEKILREVSRVDCRGES